MHQGNRDIWRLLVTAARQWRTWVLTEAVRTSSGHPVPVVASRFCGLDMGALALMAPAFGLDANQSFFEKLRVFEAECLRIWAAEASGACTEKKKQECAARHGKFLEWACSKCPDKPKDA